MRKLKLQMQMTIDGFVAGPNGEQDWVFLPGKQDPAALQSTLELARSCDTLLIGRKIMREFTQHLGERSRQPARQSMEPFCADNGRYAQDRLQPYANRSRRAQPGNGKRRPGHGGTEVEKPARQGPPCLRWRGLCKLAG